MSQAPSRRGRIEGARRMQNIAEECTPAFFTIFWVSFAFFGGRLAGVGEGQDDSLMSDHRLINQQRYLTGVHLTLKPWIRGRPDWDHDHCAFCWATFTDLELPDTVREGYVTDDDQHWICAQCFDDFRSAFQWRTG